MTVNTQDYGAVISSPLGKLGIRVADDAVTAIEYVHESTLLKEAVRREAERVVHQLHSYFDDPDWEFELPLAPEGTVFQRKVWQALRSLAPGEVLTYGELARRLNSGPRAVGNACRRNPIPIVIPCHRVVSASGPGGYSGATQGAMLMVKQWMLRHEGVDLGCK